MRERDWLVWACKGDANAVYFCEAWFRVTQIWDDLIDKDNPVSDDKINEAFHTCLVVIPANPFFARHSPYLIPILNSAIADFMDANKLERGSEEHQRIAYIIRDTASTIVTHCAYLIGGYEWMKEVSIAVREQIHDEDFKEYQESLNG